MNGSVSRSETFLVDVAWRFVDAVEATLAALARHPKQGQERHFTHPRLEGIRSFRVDPPFDRILIFYRPTANGVEAWRLMSGTRDLPNRLAC